LFCRDFFYFLNALTLFDFFLLASHFIRIHVLKFMYYTQKNMYFLLVDIHDYNDTIFLLFLFLFIYFYFYFYFYKVQTTD